MEVFRITMYLNINLVGLQVTASHENTKITTDCWTTIDKLDLNPPPKTFCTHRQKKEVTVRWGGALSQHNQILYLLAGNPYLENNYITDALPQEWGLRAPRQAPQPPGSSLGEEPPELWRPAGLACRSLTGLQETDPTLGGCTRGSTRTGTQRGAAIPRVPGPGRPAAPEGLSWLRRGRPQEIPAGVSSPGGATATSRPGPTRG